MCRDTKLFSIFLNLRNLFISLKNKKCIFAVTCAQCIFVTSFISMKTKLLEKCVTKKKQCYKISRRLKIALLSIRIIPNCIIFLRNKDYTKWIVNVSYFYWIFMHWNGSPFWDLNNLYDFYNLAKEKYM